jgi:dTDP-4-amino-4,6-dideoxygalactose transaminase
MIPLFKVAMSPKAQDPVIETLFSGYIGQGPKVAEFESHLWKEFNNPYVLTTSAGTHALHLALRVAGVGPGDEVITTPLTCTATNMPILMQGADIVWADVKDDFNISVEDVASKVTEKTKAIICMHWGGYPCDMKDLWDVADITHGIPLIEDAAHSYLSTYKDSIIGDCKYSNFTMLSFQAIKHLTSIDGGALFCKGQGDYDRAKLLRWYGINRESLRRDMRCEEEILEYGYKYHMNDVSAVVGLNNMDLAKKNVERCRDNAKFYENQLGGIDGITLTQTASDRLSSYWLFTMLVEDRTSFAHKMGSKGIHVSRVHERNDHHEFSKKYECELPGLDSIIDDMICIPVGWWVTDEDREYIVNSIKEGW